MPRDNSSETNVRFEAAVKEYESLRSELVSRMEKQHEVTNFAIALTAGVLAIIQIVPLNSQKNYDLLISIMPVVSLIYSAFSLMILEHDAVIATIQSYIDEMGLAIEKSYQELKSLPGIWKWNRYGSSWQNTTSNKIYARLMSASKHGMTFIPNFCILCAYPYLKLTKGFSLSWDVVIFAMAFVAFLLVIRTAIYAVSLFEIPASKLTRRSNIVKKV